MDAVDKAIKRACKTIKGPFYFTMIEARGNINPGRIHRWQVTIKVGFAANG